MGPRREIAGSGSSGLVRVPAWLTRCPGARQAWLAAYLLVAACGESNGPSESSGQIRVTSSTTGVSVDPEGYTVALDDGPGQPLQVNGTLLLNQVTPGNHTLGLAGVANNCHVQEQQPLTVLVDAGETTEASFTIICSESRRLAFAYYMPGEAYNDIWVINADGSGRTRLTRGLDAVSPRWSPDGWKIAYVLYHTPGAYPLGIGVMDADGTDPIVVWQESGSVGSPSWSPDSRRLVFAFNHDSHSGSGFYTTNADGSDVRWLAYGEVQGRDPAWSPDGSRIAFVQSRYGAPGEWLGDDIFTMSSDGSEVARSTSGDYNNYYSLTWSPDGMRIAYHTPVAAPDRKSALRVFPLDGSPPPYQGDHLVEDGYSPAWSPDGSMIAYEYDPYMRGPDGPRAGIWLIRPDGTGNTYLTAGREPSWAP